MQSLSLLRQKVETELQEVLSGGGSPLFDLAKMYLYHMGFCDRQGNLLTSTKGKYMRPLFLLAMVSGFGGNSDKGVPAAASLELIHRTSLIFDDIQDKGLERNNQPSVYAVWGENQAINAGFALSCFCRLALQRLVNAGNSLYATLKIMKILEESVINLCSGQYLDVAFMERTDVAVKDYIRMIQGKTGALFSASSEIAAIIAEKPDRVIDLARLFGELLGTAFQIQDDYLGIWGDEVKVGKTANDLVERKRSLPVVLALQEFPNDQITPMKTMANWLNTDFVSKENTVAIREWMENRRINISVLKMAREFASMAIEVLHDLKLVSPWDKHIKEVINLVIEREK